MEYRPRPKLLSDRFASQVAQADIERRRKEEEASRAKRVARYQEQDERDAKARAERVEALRRQQVDAAAEQLKSEMRARFLRQPGSRPADFESLWTTLLREYQKRQVLGDGQSELEQLTRELGQYHRYAGRVE